MASDQNYGAPLRRYLAGTAVLHPMARLIAARRVKQGKVDAERVDEKVGVTAVARPAGRLIWMHADGVGEALALNALITAMAADNPKLSFLVTTATVPAARAFERNKPERTVHQFVPLDIRSAVEQFLDHWRPDISIWTEGDLWPALIVETAHRGIPLAIVNGRMDAATFEACMKQQSRYADLYQCFQMVDAQDLQTRDYIMQFGIEAAVLTSSGSLKGAGAPLADAPKQRAHWVDLIGDKGIWVATSTHADDEALALAAHAKILREEPDAILIIAPRHPNRADEVLTRARAMGLSAAKLGSAPPSSLTKSVYVDARMGYLGLWYRLADVTLVGGSVGDVGGHNPYEPARLNCAILHGRNTQNFANVYAMLAAEGGCKQVTSDDELVAALLADDHEAMATAAAELAQHKQQAVAELAVRLLGLMRQYHPNG